jgi:lipopolysaccharide/colanic/teichoic acid biosynthesis glycosyltransferase
VKRTFDMTVATVGLVVTAPQLLAIALAIRAQMGGPVLFRQRRAGRRGQVFAIYKFRTMRPPAYPGEPDADRISPIGRALRSTSLDELPQLVNVLRGDMSIIGPRPTLPEQVVHYSTFQRRRLEVAPGLTGYAQVKGRNSLSWPERIELDVWYIDNRSVRLDLWILLTTTLRLMWPEGITGTGGQNPGFPVPQPTVDVIDPAGDRSPAAAGEGGGGQRDSREVPDVVDLRGDAHGGEPGSDERRAAVTRSGCQARQDPEHERQPQRHAR